MSASFLSFYVFTFYLSLFAGHLLHCCYFCAALDPMVTCHSAMGQVVVCLFNFNIVSCSVVVVVISVFQVYQCPWHNFQVFVSSENITTMYSSIRVNLIVQYIVGCLRYIWCMALD